MIRIPILRRASTDPFPPLASALDQPNGLLAAGGDLAPSRLLDAYRQGIFPWYSDGQPILWWSPDPRMVFRTRQMHVPRRLARWLRRCPWQLRADTDFRGVMGACAEPRLHQDGTWITAEMTEAFLQLHALGHAHSIEVIADGELIGGIYGLAIGRMFFGESMFSRVDHASKVALLGLTQLMVQWDWPLLDAQVSSAHLETLGGVEMPRTEFARELAILVARPGKSGSWRDVVLLPQPCELV
ncbi:MAG: leucyl/phenylalanyl-tRNA--protein transferase [Tahibacter sp.]